ncbi:hypothetical protein BCEN4_740077 [Burkholderia cenocepacia]|nr:hypothetical protein BCEN4_740077 [Burkholderia cenocepacia]
MLKMVQDRNVVRFTQDLMNSLLTNTQMLPDSLFSYLCSKGMKFIDRFMYFVSC